MLAASDRLEGYAPGRKGKSAVDFPTKLIKTCLSTRIEAIWGLTTDAFFVTLSCRLLKKCTKTSPYLGSAL